MAVTLSPTGVKIGSSGEFLDGRATNSLSGSSGTMLTFATDGSDNGVYLVGHYEDNNSSKASTAILVLRLNAGVNTVGYFKYLQQTSTSFAVNTSTGALTWSGGDTQGNYGFVIPLEDR